MLGLGTPELIIIVLGLLLLFGGKKIPEMMRGLGSGVREFKKATNIEDDDDRHLDDRDRRRTDRIDDRYDDRDREPRRLEDRRSPEVR